MLKRFAIFSIILAFIAIPIAALATTTGKSIFLVDKNSGWARGEVAESGTIAAAATGTVLVGKGVTANPAFVTMSGDASISSTGVVTVSGVSASGMSDLASTANAKGASLIGVEDASSLLTGTTLETVTTELAKYERINLADPGTGVAIPVTRSATVEITTAAAETNTLAVPTFIGQSLLLVMDVRAVGNRVITSAQRINTAGNTVITLDTAGDAILLTAIKIGGAFRWQVAFNDGATLS